MRSLLIHAWVVHESNGKYYLPYTHWVYLKEIAAYFSEITLLSPVLANNKSDEEGLRRLSDIGDIKVQKLPYAKGYVSAIKYLPQYIRAYKNAGARDVVYIRYPVPFGWLSKMFLKGSKRIIHFVGDPIDAAKNNPNFGALKKKALVSLFMPEHLTYMWACKGASVFTNGFHLAERLKSYGIVATPLISSTLKQDDFRFDENRSFSADAVNILYVGYLRKAKGVETILKAFKRVADKYSTAKLTIVGSGEFETELKALAGDMHITDKVKFAGHVDDRTKLNEFYRSHDIFSFASLSEGSPRVILEAMANGINIVSTPVGALPSIFTDRQELLYAGFRDDEQFFEKIVELVEDKALAYNLRLAAYNKVKDFTIESFIQKIFNES